MAYFVVYVRQDTQEVDVKFVMHVKTILAWTEEHASLLMKTVVINAYVLLALVEPIVKSVRLFS
jgi:hypothetical protein